VDKFVDDASTSAQKPYPARLARVLPQIEAAGILYTGIVVLRVCRQA